MIPIKSSVVLIFYICLIFFLYTLYIYYVVWLSGFEPLDI